jgi:polar amino acid transport system substrate-binding protein
MAACSTAGLRRGAELFSFSLFSPEMSMKMQKRVFLVCALSGAMAFAGMAHAQSALDQIAKARVVRIGVPADYPPYGFVGTDMKPQGLDVDMANHIAAALGARAELIPVTSTNRIPYLQTRKVDLMVSTMARNPEREKVIDFSAAAYSPFISGVYAAKEASIKTMADLAGKSIGVTRGTIEDQTLTGMLPQGASVMRFEDHSATMSAFASGQVQAVGISQPAVEAMLRRTPQMAIEYKLPISQSPNFIGIPKGDDALRDRVDQIVREARKSGEVERLSMKWLKRPAGDLPQ